MRKSILLIDDDASIRSIFRKLMKKYRYSIQRLSGNENVMQIIKQYKPQLVIVEVSIPNSARLRLISNIKERYPAIPILVTTIFSNIFTSQELLEKYSSDDQLSKPFKITDVLIKMDDLLNRQNIKSKIESNRCQMP
jgi:DNA-binding NtrC family response regulator